MILNISSDHTDDNSLLILKDMIQPDLLASGVLRRSTPDHGVFKVGCNILVNGITEVVDRALAATQHDGRRVIGCFSSRTCVAIKSVLLLLLLPVLSSCRGQGGVMGRKGGTSATSLLSRRAIALSSYV